MILAAHYFRGHIARCTRSIMSVVRTPNSRDPHVSNVYVTSLIQQKIFWLNVSVNYPVIVHVFKSDYNTGDKELSFLLIELLLFTQMITEVATSH